MIALEVRGAEEVLARVQRVKELRRVLSRGIGRALGVVRREARSRAPVWQGVLRRRISVRLDRSHGSVVGGRVRPTAPHAHLVERGRRPGRLPPVDDPRFRAYAERVGAPVFPLARAIGRRGTRPHPFWEPAVQASRGAVERILQETIETLLREVSG